ncbi:MAG TPA: hypothetical protein VHT27_10205 [Solirubrobacteraceae bacterium]|jgi:acetyltransferase-like isoleucine patch superfamily enzyme|nr:hypothetical protein [Solirubrobacteraceae bacterium]
MTIGSALRRIRLRRRSGGRASLDPTVTIARGAVVEVGASGALVVGEGSAIGRGARIIVGSGSLRIGRNVEVCEGSSITVLAEVEIGSGVSLGARSAVMDFLPPAGTVEAPLREQRIATAPVRIGDGASIGPNAVVGAGAVVLPGEKVMPGATVGRVV